MIIIKGRFEDALEGLFVQDHDMIEPLIRGEPQVGLARDILWIRSPGWPWRSQVVPAAPLAYAPPVVAASPPLPGAEMCSPTSPHALHPFLQHNPRSSVHLRRAQLPSKNRRGFSTVIWWMSWSEAPSSLRRGSTRREMNV